MPRYFIDTSDGDTFVHDDVGHDLPDARAARDAAQAALPDIARDKVPDGDNRTFCAFVRGETGTVIYRVALSLVGEWSAGQEAR
jgi:hypothetical protein